MSEVKQPGTGEVVVYVDQHAKRHAALITAVHGVATEFNGEINYPSLNLVFVTDEEGKTDPYGQQIERTTSVVHRSSQSAHGFYWEYPVEGEL